MSVPPDDDLAERVAALEETLGDLQAELEPSRGPLGLPRPPSPREVLRFTDEYAIPALIAILEANVRTLQLVRAVLRGARGAPREDEVRDRATSLGRTSVERVDGALAEIRSALDDADVPRNEEARSLLEEAQTLNRDIRNALADGEQDDRDDPSRYGVSEETTEESVPDPDEGPASPVDDESSTVEIDVDAELASIKDELDRNEVDEDDGSDAAPREDGDDE